MGYYQVYMLGGPLLILFDLKRQVLGPWQKRNTLSMFMLLLTLFQFALQLPIFALNLVESSERGVIYLDIGSHPDLPSNKPICFQADQQKITCGKVLGSNENVTAFHVPTESIDSFPKTSISIIDSNTDPKQNWGSPSLQNLIVYKRPLGMERVAKVETKEVVVKKTVRKKVRNHMRPYWTYIAAPPAKWLFPSFDANSSTSYKTESTAVAISGFGLEIHFPQETQESYYLGYRLVSYDNVNSLNDGVNSTNTRVTNELTARSHGLYFDYRPTFFNLSKALNFSPRAGLAFNGHN